MKNIKITTVTTIVVLIAVLGTVGATLAMLPSNNNTDDIIVEGSTRTDAEEMKHDLAELLSVHYDATNEQSEQYVTDFNTEEMSDEEWEETMRGYIEYQMRLEGADIVEYIDDMDYNDPNVEIWGE